MMTLSERVARAQCRTYAKVDPEIVSYHGEGDKPRPEWMKWIAVATETIRCFHDLRDTAVDDSPDPGTLAERIALYTAKIAEVEEAERQNVAVSIANRLVMCRERGWPESRLSDYMGDAPWNGIDADGRGCGASRIPAAGEAVTMADVPDGALAPPADPMAAMGGFAGMMMSMASMPGAKMGVVTEEEAKAKQAEVRPLARLARQLGYQAGLRAAQKICQEVADTRLPAIDGERVIIPYSVPGARLCADLIESMLNHLDSGDNGDA